MPKTHSSSSVEFRHQIVGRGFALAAISCVQGKAMKQNGTTASEQYLLHKEA
ncbi:hypothetical protein [Nitrosospira sp. Nsp13]|uniref:hypothetical protein n=1 Tax=Nitrosospira sp. Nsp13 TaxID=1855332 RepID=UPI0008836032|nr:hypothetical protein [Nitrosospira sp. Nsp13]SCY24079.1 hypothetical protein SAMN05216308_10623 [Nitrosospira sp. Nsp13]